MQNVLCDQMAHIRSESQLSHPYAVVNRVKARFSHNEQLHGQRLRSQRNDGVLLSCSSQPALANALFLRR